MSINQIFNLTRSLFVLDAETTGLDPKSARIVELGFQRWTSDGLMKEWRTLINPEIPIPPESTEVHKITDAMVRACRICEGAEVDHLGLPCPFTPWPTFKNLAANLAIGFKDCDYAGKNVRYDLRVLSASFARERIEWDYSTARIIDADRLEQLGEPRSLEHLYKKHLGRAMQNAHSALDDVRATSELIEAQLNKYVDLPRELGVLHELQWPGLLDVEGYFRLVNGVAICHFGKWRGRPMQHIDPSYWDFILSADFPADVRKLASDAKLGQFPGRRL